MKKIITAVALIAIVGGLVWWGAESQKGFLTREPIKIGFIGPLTGDAAAYGEPVKNAVQLAVNEINSTGGIHGRSIKVMYEDGKCSGEGAASAAQKLVNIDKVKYIIGGICSGESLTAAPIIDEAQVVMLSPVSSAVKLSGVSPYFFRNNPNDNAPATALADYLAKSYKNIAIISEQTDYSEGVKTVFIAEAEKNGAHIVTTEEYPSGATDFRSLLSKVKASNPDVIFANPQSCANLLRIAKQARELGITTQLASEMCNDPATVEADVADGIILSVTPGLSTEGKGPAFLANYTTTYGAPPPYPFYAGAGYDDVYLFAEAIGARGDSSAKVRSYFRTLPSFTGAIGTYHFDQSGDFVGPSSTLQQIKNGKLINL